MPVALAMYTLGFINRTNVSLALPAMSRDLHMDPTQAGIIAGIFFWGYLLLQIPGGDLAERWSAKRYVNICLVVWGLAAFTCGLARTWREELAIRFLLGVAEGGMYPATVILISHWFPRRERARANAFFSLALPIALIISSPLSGWLMDRWNWRVMLMVEGTFPLLFIPVWLMEMADHPHEARWISTDEREFLQAVLAREAAEREPAQAENYLLTLFQPQVLILCAIKFLTLAAQLGYLFWLPAALGKTAKLSNLLTGSIVSIPYVVGAISMALLSWHSDKKAERRGHVSFAMGVGGACLLAGVLVVGRMPLQGFVLMCLAGIGAFGPMGPFWAMTTENFSRKMAGSVAGLVNGLGNLGGVVGPFVVGYLNKQTGSFTYGFGALALFLLVGSALPYFVAPARAPAPVPAVAESR
jgi:MFS family permease